MRDLAGLMTDGVPYWPRRGLSFSRAFRINIILYKFGSTRSIMHREHVTDEGSKGDLQVRTTFQAMPPCL